MKKITFILAALLFTLSTSVVFANESDVDKSTDTKITLKEKMEKPADKLTEEEIVLLETRIDEIKAMDKAEMTRAEKHEVKEELKEHKSKIMKDDYYYMSAGGLLLLILLLIYVF